MILAASDLTDDAQLIGSFGTLLVAATGFVVAILKINQANRTAKDTLQHVNGLEDAERVVDEDDRDEAAPRVTLGSEVRAIRRAVGEGFERNDALHGQIEERLQALEAAMRLPNGGTPRRRPRKPPSSST